MSGDPGRQLRFALDDLYATAPAFHRVGGEIGGELERATRKLEGMGNFWGDDKAGRQFGQVYGPAQSKLLELLAVVSGEVEGIGDGISKMADEYDAAEQKTKAVIQSLYGRR